MKKRSGWKKDRICSYQDLLIALLFYMFSIGQDGGLKPFYSIN